MLRHGSRRPWRLVRVGVPSSCLNVLTGTRHRGLSRAGALGAVSVETLRRAAFSLVAGVFCVSGGRETGARRGLRRGGRWMP